MSGINYFPENLNVENKTIIVRFDLNVPLKEKKIEDHTRIKLILPFLNRLIIRKAKIIIISHLGRPKGIKNTDLSLVPIYKFLKEQIKTNIYFYSGDIDNDTKNKSSYLKSGEILLIENIRFFKEEINNDEVFAKKLASLGEIYVNDAFSCSHRKQASIHKITKFIKESYAGPLLKKEVEASKKVIEKEAQNKFKAEIQIAKIEAEKVKKQQVAEKAKHDLALKQVEKKVAKEMQAESENVGPQNC